MAEQSEQIREKRAELILQQLDELPTLPEVALRVLEATGSETSSAEEVAKVIASDPSLTARVLQLVHRADAGIRGEVNTVERAVVLSASTTIGPDVVRILGVSSASPAGLPSLNLRQNLDWAERETVRRALGSAGGVKKDAAEVMGISQRALSYYLAKHRVE